MSAPTKEDEIETYLANLGARLSHYINGKARYKIPGEARTYSIEELLEASEKQYAYPETNTSTEI